MIIPFINVRGGDIVYPREALNVAVQNGIQQIYNEYNWSWLFNSIEIKKDEFKDWNIYFWYDMWPLKNITLVMNNHTKVYLDEAKNLTELNCNTYLRHWNYILMRTPADITVGFYKDYEWILPQPGWSTEIPMPNTMIPSLYYLVLSQIDMIEVVQPEQETRTNYNKYRDQITLKKNSDSITLVSIWWGGRH